MDRPELPELQHCRCHVRTCRTKTTLCILILHPCTLWLCAWRHRSRNDLASAPKIPKIPIPFVEHNHLLRQRCHISGKSKHGTLHRVHSGDGLQLLLVPVPSSVVEQVGVHQRCCTGYGVQLEFALHLLVLGHDGDGDGELVGQQCGQL